MVVEKRVRRWLDAIGIVEGAGEYADLSAGRTGKGKGAAATWTEAPLDLRRGFVNCEFTLGPNEVLSGKPNVGQEGRARLPLAPSAMAVNGPFWFARALVTQVAA
jgi:hypothetical protein